jgi:DNA-binding LytR/AlgR family response regulator
MIIAIAIDDEPKALQVISSHVSKLKNIELAAQFTDPVKAVSFLRENPVDLMFLDINMPRMTGMELLAALKAEPHLIFTTAYSQYALDSYSYNAVDYLLKPFEFDRFKIAVEKAEERIRSKEDKQPCFFIKDGFKSIRILFDDILLIRGSGNYLDIVTKEKVYSPRMTFSDILAIVPSSGFARVHQSFIVNINAIDKLENNHVFIEGHKVPVSNSFREIFFKRLKL